VPLRLLRAVVKGLPNTASALFVARRITSTTDVWILGQRGCREADQGKQDVV